MVTEIYTAITTSISELKKNPIKAAEHDVVCVLNRCKPAFYTISPEYMKYLKECEKQLRHEESSTLCEQIHGAEKDKRSLTKFIEKILEDYVDNEKANERLNQKRINVNIDDL